MRIEPKTDIDRWINPPSPDDQPEPGYEEWLKAEIAEGIAQLDAGKGIPAEEVWKSLGLE